MADGVVWFLARYFHGLVYQILGGALAVGGGVLCTWWAKSHNKGETICFSWRETSKVRLHSIIIFFFKKDILIFWVLNQNLEVSFKILGIVCYLSNCLICGNVLSFGNYLVVDLDVESEIFGFGIYCNEFSYMP